MRHLEQIVQICRAGSFSAAARRLGISQPALSKSIARLEAELSVQLFDRSTGVAQPTTFGSYLASRGENLLESAFALTSEVQQWARGDAGRLRIGIGPVTRIKPLPEVLERIASSFPALQVSVRQELGTALARAVHRGRLDLAFSYHENAEDFGDLIRIKIFEDEQIAAVRPDHPGLAAGPYSAQAMLQYPMATFGDLPSFRRMLSPLEPAQEANLIAFIGDDGTTICRRAQLTDAIARAPRFVIEPYLRDGRLVELPTSWRSNYECWLLTTEGHWRSPVIKAIADFARAPALVA